MTATWVLKIGLWWFRLLQHRNSLEVKVMPQCKITYYDTWRICENGEGRWCIGDAGDSHTSSWFVAGLIWGILPSSLFSGNKESPVSCIWLKVILDPSFWDRGSILPAKQMVILLAITYILTYFVMIYVPHVAEQVESCQGQRVSQVWKHTSQCTYPCGKKMCVSLHIVLREVLLAMKSEPQIPVSIIPLAQLTECNFEPVPTFFFLMW